MTQDMSSSNTAQLIEAQDKGSHSRATQDDQINPDELESLLPIMRVQRGIPHKVLALFNNEIVVGARWFSLKFGKDDFIPNDTSHLLSKLSWGKRFALNDCLKVTIIKPCTGRISDKSWLVLVQSKKGTRRFTLPYEEGGNVIQYFKLRAPGCLHVQEDESDHFHWRVRRGCLWSVLLALGFCIAYSALRLFLPHDSAISLLVPLIPFGLIFIFAYVVIFRDSRPDLNPQHALWFKKKKRKPSREPFRSPLLGWLLKAIAIGWYCLCYFWIEDQQWFHWIEYRMRGVTQPGLYLLLYSPTLFLIYRGYQICQHVSKLGEDSEATSAIMYLRAFDDDQRITLQPTSLLAKFLGVVVGGLPNDWGKVAGLDGARFRMAETFVLNLHPVHIIRLFFNKGADTAEEVLTAFFSKFGKVVIFGRPGQKVTTRGARHLYIEDHAWQEAVLEHLKHAQIVVIQPGVSAGVRWEISRSFETVQPQRLLFSLGCFWRRPNAFEDFRLKLPEDIRRLMPVEVPHLDRPTFLYFENDWTPRLQLISYRSPLLWVFVGDAVDLKYTLSPFVEGANGDPRQSPREPKKYPGHTLLAWLGFAAFLFLVLPGQFLRSEVISHRESIRTSPTVKYNGPKVPYSIQLRRAWQQLDIQKNSSLLDYLFVIDEGAAEIEVFSDRPQLGPTNFPDAQIRSLREEYMNALLHLPAKRDNVAETRLIDYYSVLINGREWVVLQIKIELHNGLELYEHSRFYLADGEMVIIRGTIVDNDAFYLKLFEEIFDSISFN